MQTAKNPEADVLEILSEGSDGMYAVDSNQRIVVWNKQAERILGWTAGEVLGSHCHEIVGGMAHGQGICGPNCSSISLARVGTVPPSHTVLSKTKSGEPRWIGISHVLVPNDSRKLGALVHIFRDATEAVEATKTVERLVAVIRPLPDVNVTFATPNQSGTKSPPNPLTGREVEVLRLLSQGQSGNDIARQLVLSNTTTRNHIQHILAKLDVHSRLEAVVFASRQGII